MISRKKIYYFLFALILILSAFLRFKGLTNRDFWYDEAFTGIVVRWDWGKMIDGLARDVHPPLYYILLKGWASIFHYNAWGMRSFSAIFGIAGIVVVFFLTRKIFKSLALALLAGFITGIAPFNIQYSQEARMYTLFGFFILLAIYFFYLFLVQKEKRLLYSILWALFFSLAVNTHYLTFFLGPLFYLNLVIFRYFQNRREKCFTEKMKLLIPGKNFMLSIGIIVLSLVPWLKVLIKQLGRHELGWIPPAHLWNLIRTIQIFFFGSPPGVGGIPLPNHFKFLFDSTSMGFFLYSLILILLVGFLLQYKSKTLKLKPIIFLAVFGFGLPVLMVLASYAKIYLYVSRYFMPSALILQILLLGLVWQLCGKKFTLILIGFYLLLIFNLNLPPANRNLQLAARFVQQEGWSTNLYALNPGDFAVLKYYLGPERVYLYNQDEPDRDFSGWVVIGNQKRITDKERIFKDKGAVIIGEIKANEIEKRRLKLEKKWKNFRLYKIQH